MKKAGKCIIISGAPIRSMAGWNDMVCEQDYVICADHGYDYAIAAGLDVDLVVGDLDSVNGRDFGETKLYAAPAEKDDTDTLLACRFGVKEGYREFLILAALGGRLDHTLANLQTMCWLYENGCTCRLEGDYEFCTAVKDGTVYLSGKEKECFSVFSLAGEARGVSIKHAKYPLDNATLTGAYPVGVSNEFLGKEVQISVKSGVLFLIIPKSNGKHFSA